MNKEETMHQGVAQIDENYGSKSNIIFRTEYMGTLTRIPNKNFFVQSNQ